MNWVKKGVIFAPDGSRDWMATHATLPVADAVAGDRLRVYFGSRDRGGRSQTTFLEVDARDPSRVLYVHDRPILPLGPPGTFDDSGIMPSWLVAVGGEKWLYYIGWNQQVSVPYRLAIGLAVSRDGGRTFEKHSPGPVRDRNRHEPYFCTAPCVWREGDRWRMWFISCTGWDDVAGRFEPRYHVRHTESPDGGRWDGPSRACVENDAFAAAIGRPCVFHADGRYKMLYSYRGLDGYRTDPAQSYRLGYAESTDGIAWARKDHLAGIDRSARGWDSQMMEYCFVHPAPHGTYLFYNGNGFGLSGVGYAVLAEG